MLPHRALPPLLAAAACALAAVVVWLTAYHLSPFEAIDQRTFDGFLGLSRPATAGWATRFSHLADPGPFALFAAALVLVALARRRLRTAVVVAIVLAGSNVSTQLLKPALAKPEVFPGVETATWPSGHATAAMALVLCLLLVVPLRLRPAAAAFGGLFALAVVYSILILGHHEPSDILGGFLMAGAWTALGVAALRALAPERAVRAAARRHAPPRGPDGGRAGGRGGRARAQPLAGDARLRRRPHDLPGGRGGHHARARWGCRPPRPWRSPGPRGAGRTPGCPAAHGRHASGRTA